jgi:hypothetical protein
MSNNKNNRPARAIGQLELTEITTAWENIPHGGKGKVVEAAGISWASIHNILGGKNAEIKSIRSLRVALGLSADPMES